MVILFYLSKERLENHKCVLSQVLYFCGTSKLYCTSSGHLGNIGLRSGPGCVALDVTSGRDVVHDTAWGYLRRLAGVPAPPRPQPLALLELEPVAGEHLCRCCARWHMHLLWALQLVGGNASIGALTSIGSET